MQMETAAAHIGKKSSWQLIAGSLFLNLKKKSKKSPCSSIDIRLIILGQTSRKV